MAKDKNPKEDPPVNLPVVYHGGQGKAMLQHIFYASEGIRNPTAWEMLERCLKSGLTEAQIGAIFDVSRETIWRMRMRDAEFAEFYNKHKSFSNKMVEDSLYQRAVGYDVTVNEVYVINGQINVIEVNKHYPPEVKAQEVWLYNRTNEWRKTQTVINKEDPHKLPDAKGFDLTKLSPVEIEELIRLSTKAAVGLPENPNDGSAQKSLNG